MSGQNEEFFKIGNVEFAGDVKLADLILTVQDIIKIIQNSTGSGTSNQLEWSSEAIYSMNNFVSYVGKLYKSVINNNKGNVPSSSNFWELYSSGSGSGGTGEVENGLLVIPLNGEDIATSNYKCIYSNDKRTLTVEHGLNSRVIGSLYDYDNTIALFGMEYIDDNTIVISFPEDDVPTLVQNFYLVLCADKVAQTISAAAAATNNSLLMNLAANNELNTTISQVKTKTNNLNVFNKNNTKSVINVNGYRTGELKIVPDDDFIQIKTTKLGDDQCSVSISFKPNKLNIPTNLSQFSNIDVETNTPIYLTVNQSNKIYYTKNELDQIVYKKTEVTTLLDQLKTQLEQQYQTIIDQQNNIIKQLEEQITSLTAKVNKLILNK